MTKLLDQTLKSISDAQRYIFISDIHGNKETLSLINQAMSDYPAAQVIAGGDYIDGRNNVKDVLDFLLKLQDSGAIILKGNHEQMLLNYADEREHQAGIWFYNGGADTLEQLFKKVLTAKELKKSIYYQFLAKLPIMYETPKFIFVHAGVRSDNKYNLPSSYAPKLDVSRGKYTYDFYRIWAREQYIFQSKHAKIFAHNFTNKTIVTGHTPTSAISGQYDTGIKLSKTVLNPVKIIQYDNEPARIFTDGGAHSNPQVYPHNDGNVVVLNQDGTIEHVYNYKNTLQ